MSRLAKRAIDLPKGVELKVSGNNVDVKGPKGSLTHVLMPGISLKQEENQVWIVVDPNLHKNGKDAGLHWALLRNTVNGVSQGFEKRLTLIGVGYKAVVKGNKLDVQVGYSHPTEVDIPSDLQVKVDKNTVIISGINKQKVGQFAATVRQIRPPEPYKGKGIRYEDEYVRKKAGKAAKGK